MNVPLPRHIAEVMDRTAAESADAPGGDPLRLTHCPGCGYQLEGLPPAGTCPECGRGYDPGIVILHGYARGGYADLATARPGVAVVLTLLYGLMVLKWLTRSGADPFNLLCVALFLPIILWGLWRRWTNDLPGLIQVRLSDEGCCQVQDPGKADANRPEMTPWSQVHDVRIEPRRGDRVWVKIKAKAPKWNVEPVDAEVHATPEQAAALVWRVRQWRDGV